MKKIMKKGRKTDRVYAIAMYLCYIWETLVCDAIEERQEEKTTITGQMHTSWVNNVLGAKACVHKGNTSDAHHENQPTNQPTNGRQK